MKKAIPVIIAALIGLIAAPAGVAEPAPAHSPDEYIIGPKDKLEIEIWGEPGMPVQVTVSADGIIHFQLIDEVKVGGLTVAQAPKKLKERLSEFYKDPIVLVKIFEYLSKEVQILGAVSHPGSFMLTTNYTTLLGLIAMASGATGDRGNYAYIYRKAIPVLAAQKEPEKKPEKIDGPDSRPEEGNTAEEPPQPEKQPTIEDRIKELEGVEREEVDLRGLLDEGDPSKDMIIYPGDVVIVSSKELDIETNFVWLEGQVRKPGRMPWAPGMTIMRAITEAGGVTDMASPNRTTIKRTHPAGTVETIKVRLKDIKKNKKPDIALEPGDMVSVPESYF